MNGPDCNGACERFVTSDSVTSTSTCCPAKTHDHLKADVRRFMSGTTNQQHYEGLILALCAVKECQSMLALTVCVLCSKPCPNTDALPVTDDSFAHALCLLKRSLKRGRMTFTGWVRT